MKRVNITTFVLLAYLIVMSVIGWPGKPDATLGYTEYFSMIGISLIVIFALRFVQAKRARMRDDWKKSKGQE